MTKDKDRPLKSIMRRRAWVLPLPESCHEARTTSLNLALAGLFKHPLKDDSS